MKQPEHNLRVVKHLGDAGHDVVFVFTGDGSLRARLEQTAIAMGLEGHVVFAGNRPQEWLAAVLPDARLVLSPHMGRALAEACLAAVPIIAYDVDWQREIVRSGDTGELVPAGDWEEMARRADRLLVEPARAGQLGQRARQEAIAMMDPQALAELEIGAYEALFRNTSRSE